MQIFNISELFATPVTAASATTDTLNKTSRKRRRKPTQVVLPNTNCAERAIDNNSDGNNAQVNLKAIAPYNESAAATISTLDKTPFNDRWKLALTALPCTNCVQEVPDSNSDHTNAGGNATTIALCDKTTNTVANQKTKPKKKKRKRTTKAADELPSEVTTANSAHSDSEKSGDNVDGNTARSKVTENMKEEVKDLMTSLEQITSQRNALEKSLNKLREENDRLVRSNEDLKDELKEMTDEALELSVEKQRLLSKIGTLKKQLLNRPK